MSDAEIPPLPSALHETFAALSDEWRTKDEIRCRIFLFSRDKDALGMKLAALARRGLVERRYLGKMGEYRRAPTQPSAGPHIEEHW